ncbi:MAG: hypothetical protein HY898_35790 [Deltaproteobacteria bacterium]|nr:hypothetical protein [Deltaproteobacteria bacterium]
MAESKNESQPKKSKRARQERRFLPTSSSRALASLIATIVGGLALGAGIYSQWISATPLEWSHWIVGGGAVVLAGVILWGDFGGQAVRVGDAGLALEQSGQPLVRLNWPAVRSVRIKGGELLVEGEDREISFAISKYPSAAAWAVKEALRRVPKKVKVNEEQRSALPAAQETDGEVIPLEKLQVTGSKCKASGKIITFEKDARTCPKCGEIYHREGLPDSCMTCEADLRSLKAKAGS